MKKLAYAATLLAATALPANADVILGGQNWTGTGNLLTLEQVVPGGNQPLNIQCIICGDNQPQQQVDFGYTNFKNAGNLTDALFFSTNVAGGANPGLDTVGVGYDGSFLRNYLIANGDASLLFNIGIDVNDNGGAGSAQILESFFLLNLTQHIVLAAFSPGPGGTAVPSINNGTGFPDYTLTGFNINLGTDVQAGDKLIFFARLSNANDGPDSFFIEAVPGPALGVGLSGLLSGFAMAALAWYRRRRSDGDLPFVT